MSKYITVHALYIFHTIHNSTISVCKKKLAQGPSFQLKGESALGSVIGSGHKKSRAENTKDENSSKLETNANLQHKCQTELNKLEKFKTYKSEFKK